MNKSASITNTLSLLHTAYPHPKTELENWNTPVQFMVCVMLSAQATDKGVNKVTGALFERYKTADDFVSADFEELAKAVSSINFYRTKAKNIQKACQFLLKEYHGEFPPDIEKLIKIPGIGRKSANVILNEALGLSQGVVVDTHISRVSWRLGLQPYQDAKDAEKIEAVLKEVVPREEWKFFSNAVVLLGRYVCKAKKPNCTECVLKDDCPSAFRV